jgi:hypothetical protein
MDEIEAFHARARRRRRVIYTIGVIALLAIGVFCIWLSAITKKSTTFTRAQDLDPLPRTLLVGGVVVFLIVLFLWRMRKDSR